MNWKRLPPNAIALITGFLLLVFNLVFSAQPSLAHWADLSTAEIVVETQSVHLTLTLPADLLKTLPPKPAIAAPGLNAPVTDAPGVAASGAESQDLIPAYLRLTNQGQPPIQVTVNPITVMTNAPQSTISAATHRSYQVTYRWDTPIQDLKVDYQLFPPGVKTAQCLATITQGDRFQQYVFTPQRAQFTLDSTTVWQQVYEFLVLGVEHILTGYDHILFVISVILTQQRLRDLFKVVTAFTVAHSFTLALSTLNIITLPAVWVESAIALSIVYMAYRNLRSGGFSHRNLLTFGFGLLHGLGFASILRGVELTPQRLLVSLASFNLGVELGQLAIVTVVVVLLRQVQRMGWHQGIVKWSSLGIMAVGSYWFVQRAFGL
jgi:hydrogenase/urease accessory protein HupE